MLTDCRVVAEMSPAFRHSDHPSPGGFGYDSCASGFDYGAYDPVSCGGHGSGD
jgi:hypothetical protein